MDQLTDITSPGAAFREVAEQLPGLAIFDAQGLCVYANPRAAELFGAERESLLGRGWWRAMNPDDATAFDADWRAARAEGRSYERDFLLSTSAGERWLSVRVAPAADGCWLATLDDRTTEAEARAQLAAREAEFRLLAEHSNDMICRHDAVGTYLYVSPAALTLFGYEPAEMLGKSPYDLVHPDDLAGFSATHADMGAGAPDAVFTARFRHKDGSWVWAESTATVVRDAAGAFVEVQSATREVTDRKRVEEELRAGEERFRSAFDNAPIGMSITGLDGRVVLANRVLAELLGRTVEDMVGVPFADYTHPDDHAEDARWAAHMLAGEVSRGRWEKRYLHADGSSIEIEVSLSLVRDSAGEPDHFLAQVVDLTERNRAQREADQLKNEFFALVSHELRTPLTSIAGYAHVLLEDNDGEDEEQERFLRVIDRNAKRLQRLIGDMLFAAQIEAGEMALEIRTADMSAIALEAVVAARPSADAREVELTALVEPVDPIPGDADRLAQVIDNLLSNAIKFTPSGGRVTVRVAQSDGVCVAEVEDTGIGVAAADRERVFERFYRASGATYVAGVGLGLSIARSITEGHGGSIAISGGPGPGTTVRVELPLV